MKNNSLIGTFITGVVGIVGFAALIYLAAPIIPYILIALAILSAIYLILAPKMRKATEEASQQIQDDE